MNFKWIALLVFLGTASGYQQEEDVFVLKTSNYEQWIKEHQDYLRVTEFYAPWCQHCQNLAPEYQDAARILREKGVKVVLAKIDATEEKDLAKKFEVKSYPTLKMYLPYQNAPQDYKGPRDANGIIQYLQRHADKNILLNSLQDLQDLRNKHQELPIYLGVFSEEKTNLWQYYQQIISERDVIFKLASIKNNEEVSKFLGIEKEAIVIFRPLLIAEKDEKQFASKSEAQSKQELNDWLDNTSLNQYIVLYYPVQEILKQRNITYGLLITKANARKAAKLIKYYYSRLKKLSEANDNLIMGVLDIQLMDAFLSQIKRQNSKGLFYIQVGPEKYILEDDVVKKEKLLTDLIEPFLTKFKKGEIEPNIKTQPIPEQEYENDVKIVVRKNFKSFQEDKSKDAVILFYASWCQHSQKLLPTYEQLGSKYINSSVLIVKYEASENELPIGWSIEGYPTIFFLPAMSKKPIFYDGERILEDLIQFVEANREIKPVKEEF